MLLMGLRLERRVWTTSFRPGALLITRSGLRARIRRKTRSIRKSLSFLPKKSFRSVSISRWNKISCCLCSYYFFAWWNFNEKFYGEIVINVFLTSKHSNKTVNKRNYDKNTIKSVPIVWEVIITTKNETIGNSLHHHFQCEDNSKNDVACS